MEVNVGLNQGGRKHVISPLVRIQYQLLSVKPHSKVHSPTRHRALNGPWGRLQFRVEETEAGPLDTGSLEVDTLTGPDTRPFNHQLQG